MHYANDSNVIPYCSKCLRLILLICYFRDAGSSSYNSTVPSSTTFSAVRSSGETSLLTSFSTTEETEAVSQTRRREAALDNGINGALEVNMFTIALELCQRSSISISGGCLLKLIENESFMAQLAFDVQREDNPMKEQLVLCLLKRQRGWSKKAAQESLHIGALTMSSPILTELVRQGAYLNRSYAFGIVGEKSELATGYSLMHLLSSRWAVVPMYTRSKWFFQEDNQQKLINWMSRAEQRAKVHSRRLWGQVREAKRLMKKSMISGKKFFRIAWIQTIENSVRTIVLDSILSVVWSSRKEEWKVAAKSQDIMTGSTALHHLAWSGNSPGIEIFVSRFPSVLNYKDRIGRTSLDVAIEMGRSMAVQTLLALGGQMGSGRQKGKIKGQSEGSRSSGESGKSDAGKALVDRARQDDARESAEGVLHNEKDKAAEKKSHHDDDKGGWDAVVPLRPLPPVREDVCDFDVRENITAEEFYQDYLLPGRPLILRGFAKHWRLRREWTRKELIKRYGRLWCEASGIPYAVQYGKEAESGSNKITLRAFTNAMSSGNALVDQDGNELFIFEDPRLTRGGNHLHETLKYDNRMIAAMQRSYPILPFFLRTNHTRVYPASQQFYIGPPGGGAPIHMHGDAWNACAYGKRQWFLFPPERALYSKVPMREWVREELPKLTEAEQPLQCTQGASDLLYIPNMWGHGTFNLEASVGVAVEMETFTYTPPSLEHNLLENARLYGNYV